MQKFLVLTLIPLCFGAPQEGFGDASQEEIAQIRAGTFLEDSDAQYSYNYKVADEDSQTYMAQEESRAGESVTGSYSYVDPYGSLITVTYTAGPMGYQETRNVQENFVVIRASAASSGSSSGGSLETSSFSVQSGSSSGGSSSGFSSGSSGSSSSGQQSSFTQSDIISSVVNQVQPLISQTVSSAVSGSRRPVPTPSATLSAPGPRPTATSSTSSSSAQSDIVAKIVSQISPLVSQTVNSAVSGASSSRFASRPAPTRRVVAPQPVRVAAPAPIVQVLAPVQAPLVARGSDSVGSLFGDGNFNVRFNTPDFNIEY